jgi:hypothetical protein
MIADLYQRPSFAEIAARIGAEPVPAVPVTVAGPEPEPKQAELLPGIPDDMLWPAGVRVPDSPEGIGG